MGWFDDALPGLTPHGFCLTWQPWLMALHASADALTFLAYFSIPLCLMRLARARVERRQRWIAWLFVGFILACGSTHGLAIVTLWFPIYVTEGLVKAATAALSVVTAAALWPLVPQILAMPSRLQVDRLNAELRLRIAEHEATNARLEENERRLLDAQLLLAARVEEGSYALQVAAEQQRALFENSPDALFVVRVETDRGRPDFVFEAVNPATARMSGRDAADFAGRRPQDSHAPEAARELLDAYRRCALGGTVVTFASRRAMGGREREIETSLAPARDPRSGVVSRIIGVARDVTERGALERQVRHMQKMEVTGRLTAGVAHDFNNLLQALMGGLEMLMLEVEGPAQEYAELSLQAARRGAELTHRLLSFSRQQALQPRPVDLCEALVSVRGLLGGSLGPRVAVVMDLPTEPVAAFADAGQLQSALLNLLVNAGDAMADGGRVVLSAGRGAPPPDLELAAGEWASVAVADTGAGMDAAVMQQACEPFFTTKGLDGTGLGLSMVQGFVRQSGGDMRIRSTPGAGTRVELWLPLAPAADDVKGMAAPLPRDVHVLLVDDAPDVLVTAGAFLSHAGWTVTRAASGDLALAKLAAGLRCDVVVTDYAMPGLNGLDLAREARALRPGLPAIIMTGFGEALAGHSARVRVLRKPFGRTTLVGEITDVLTSCDSSRHRPRALPLGPGRGLPSQSV